MDLQFIGARHLECVLPAYHCAAIAEQKATCCAERPRLGCYIGGHNHSNGTLGVFSNLSSNAAALIARLTRRERQILGCILSGLSSKAAARKLRIGFETARKHRASIYRKLAVSSPADLIVRFADDAAFFVAQGAHASAA